MRWEEYTQITSTQELTINKSYPEKYSNTSFLNIIIAPFLYRQQ